MDKEINNNGYDYVDLDLPSGTLWATKNVGASSPYDYGLYFQWGDIKGYSKYEFGNGKWQKIFARDFSDYKFSIKGNDANFSKYTTKGDVLKMEDDAANFHMGGDWYIPTPAQIWELIDNTTTTWTMLDGIRGIRFTSKRNMSKSIFIPAAGFVSNGSLNYSGTEGYIWSSMLSKNNVTDGQYLGFYSEGIHLYGNYRNLGFPIRGVIDKKRDKHKEKKSNMNENLDLVKILKDAPKGTKLWSPIYGKCTFLGIDEDGGNNEHSDYPIDCEADGVRYSFTKEGKLFEEYSDTECVLFPSKENRDWSTFKVQKPHKHFEPFQKVLVGLIGSNNKQLWTRDVYMYYRKDVEEHCTAFESMVPDELIIPYDAKKDGKPVSIK